MKALSHTPKARGAAERSVSRGERGALLPVVLISLTVVTTLGTAVFMVLLRQYDRLAWQEERSVMSPIHRAVREHVMDATSIPAPGELLSSVASRAGLSPSQATVNARGIQRVVLVEPRFGLGTIGTQGSPFRQGMTGSRLPQSPRSSCSAPLGNRCRPIWFPARP